MEKRKIIRQGDVLFYEIKSVDEVCSNRNYKKFESKEYVVKKGETGNKHLLVAETPFMILKTIDGKTIIEIKDGKAVLRHEEHKQLEIPKGIYLVKNEREYDYDKEGWHYVRD